MKRISTLVVAALVALGVAGCGHSVSAGTVIDKHDRPAYTEIYNQPQYRQQCTEEPEKVGNVTEEVENCTQVIYGYIPTPIHHNEAWSLELRDSKGKTGWVGVSQGVYDSTHLGQFYNSKDGS